MKRHSTNLATVMWAALALVHGHCLAASGFGMEFLPNDRKAPVAAAPTDDALKKQRSSGKFSGFVPAGEEPKGWDLMQNSEFISYDGQSTLLPKGAILSVPEKFRQNVVTKPVGKLMVWTEFAGRYRGLVTYFPVSIEQASGQRPLDPQAFAVACKSGLLVVAVLQGNPISVSPKAMPAVQATPQH